MTAKDMFIQVIRSVLALFLGLMIISIIAEGIEFVLVAVVHGSITTDQDTYFGIRNRPALLAAKFVYNGAAGFAGGYATAGIVGRAPMMHGLLLALIQLAALIYGMTASPYASTTPLWAWIVFSATMVPMILVGSWFQSRRRIQQSGEKRQPSGGGGAP